MLFLVKQKDGGNRKFILVQLPELVMNSEAFKMDIEKLTLEKNVYVELERIGCRYGQLDERSSLEPNQ